MKREDALDYHASGRPGKIAVVPTKPLNSQRDLALAYSPGVAIPCLEIESNADDAYKYTAKGNLVAVVSNGTAVLGLGNIGPLAAKPVMEGKANLFKQFADLDVFDLEVGSENPDDVIKFCQLLEPTVGGINLEDIRAPDCFYIEETLRKTMRIPVFHDDQHGTAIISGAALLNALEIVGKKIEKVRVVFSGAGAAAISTAEHYVRLGVPRENILLTDRQGVIYEGRPGELDPYKAKFANKTKARTVADALAGADVFVGLSVAGAITGEMVAKMAKKPIIFALANPEPEILPEQVRAVRSDAIIATGRSDFPNQVNNVLGFPFIFRGALDVRATQINEAMKLAAVHALADLAKTPVPDIVNMAYNEKSISFGPRYIIPKPFDPRLLSTISPAVAKAAIESNVAQIKIENWEAYAIELNKRLGLDNQLMRVLGSKARSDPRRLVFAEADNIKILKVAQLLFDEGVAYPILLGNKERIRATAAANKIDIEEFPIVDPRSEEQDERRKRYTEIFFQKRQRRGFNKYESTKIMRDRNYFGCMMVETGEADAMISGLTKNYPDTIRPAIEII